MKSLHLHTACIPHNLSMLTLSFCHAPMSMQCLHHCLPFAMQHVAFTQGICVWPPLCSLCADCLLQARTTSFLTTPQLRQSAHSPTAQTADPDHIQSPRFSHEPVYLVPAWDPFTACVLLEVTQAPAHILRCIYSVATGIPTATSPALDIASLCLSLWLALESVQLLRLVRPQISKAYYCRQLTAGHFS